VLLKKTKTKTLAGDQKILNIMEGKLSRDFIYTNSNSVKSDVKRKTVKREIVIGPKAIKFIALFVIAILSVVYLSQSTAGAGRSVEIRDIHETKASLILEQERMEAEQTRLRALREIDLDIERQNLENFDNKEEL